MTEALWIAVFGGVGVTLAEIIKAIVESILAGQGKSKEAKINARLTEIDEKIDEGFNDINTRIEDINHDIQLERVKNARIRILRYSDEITAGMEHSKESFDQTLVDMDEYEDYCRVHPEFENNRTVLANHRIRDVYKQLLKSNGFL